MAQTAKEVVPMNRVDDAGLAWLHDFVHEPDRGAGRAVQSAGAATTVELLGTEPPGLVALRIVFGTAVDSTSHNLWPFEILQASVVSLVLIGAMMLGRRVVGR